MIFINQDAAIHHVRAGKLRPLAVTSAQRNPLYPDVPTIAELLGPEVAPIEGPLAFRGAFPRWSPAERRLYWVDALAPALRVYDGGEDRELLAVESPITGLVLRGEELLVTHEAGVLRVLRDGRCAPVTAWPAGQLLALARGDDDVLWAALGAAGGCAVGTVQRGGVFDLHWTIEEPVQARCWGGREAQLQAAAPGSGSLLILRPGAAGVRRLATLPKGSGQLSGLALDAAGGVWTALRDGWSVVRVAADGTLDRMVGLPVPHPTDVAVAGHRLYVTTARQPVPLDILANAPVSGRLLTVSIVDSQLRLNRRYRQIN